MSPLKRAVRQQETHCTLCGGELVRNAVGFHVHQQEPRHVAYVQAATRAETTHHELNRCEGRRCWCQR